MKPDPSDFLDPRNWPSQEAPLPADLVRQAHQDLARAEKRDRQRRVIRSHRARQMALLIGDALDGGATRQTANRYEWDVSRGCKEPVVTEINSSGVKGSVTILAACRRCEVCGENRRRMWAARAWCEARSAVRNWQVTLTLRPEEQVRARYKAIRAAERRGLEWSALSAEQQFQRRCQVIGDDISLWLARVRRRCVEEWTLQGVEVSASFRYLLVAEQHESGEPHFHLLLHELSELQPIRNDWLCKPPRRPTMREWWMPPQIDARWHLGFVNMKLKAPDKVAYVAKYLTKSLLARVRASKRYGEQTASAPPQGETRPPKNSF